MILKTKSKSLMYKKNRPQDKRYYKKSRTLYNDCLLFFFHFNGLNEKILEMKRG